MISNQEDETIKEDDDFKNRLNKIHDSHIGKKNNNSIPPQTISKIGTGDDKNKKIILIYKRYIDKCSLLKICG